MLRISSDVAADKSQGQYMFGLAAVLLMQLWECDTAPVKVL